MRYTINDLMDSMVLAVQGWTADFRFPSSAPLPGPNAIPNLVQPKVWAGKIPSTLAGFMDTSVVPTYPCILLEAYKFSYNRTSGKVIVRIVIGTYEQSTNRRSWRDNQLALSTLVLQIYQNPLIGGNFLHEDEPEVEGSIWDDPDNQAPDHSFSMILVPYGMMTPSPNEPRPNSPRIITDAMTINNEPPQP